MPRHSTPLTEEKCSVKGIFNAFLGENAISAKDIPKLDEWPTISGEGEYNNIEFKDRLSSLHPDMSDSMINLKILRRCGGELEHAINFRFLEPCSSENYINAMGDIITRTKTGKTWARTPIESKMVPKISRDDKRP
ncbi:hypothetical protein O181_025580 [Austropuccinia psidii MF-1]|uniref:Uncharacterized protein n=1 Tax=Austropuccinia psidii MF-1 TaxID=1389203 RepID=A0A9Q3CMW8_9BASI|nr:hypothetical protein [Austropuccinia psidii MF-1]